AVVEDLNVLNVVRVEEMVAYISSQHPRKKPNVPKIDFGLTAINGLRVRDSILSVHLDLDRLSLGNHEDFPEKAPLFNKNVWDRPGKKKEFDPEKGLLKCSLVEEIEVIRGDKDLDIEDNIITIPDFGRVYVAELLVSGDTYELIMMRLEL